MNDVSEPDAAQVYRLCRLFSGILEQIVEAGAREAAQTNGRATAVQYHALEFIHLHPGCCIKDLATGVGTSHPAALTLVERLEAQQLVSRCRSRQDRRMIQLSATNKGADFVSTTRSRCHKTIEELLQSVSGHNGSEFSQGLHQFIQAAANIAQSDLSNLCLHCGTYHTEACPMADTCAARP